MSASRDLQLPGLPTIKDVAKLAGVSKTTAGDALTGKGRVSGRTRARVEDAAVRLGYRPHAGARDLTRRRSEVLGLLVGDFSDPFNAELTGQLERQAAANGFRVLLATAGPDLGDEAAAVSNLIEHRVAALILVAYTGDDRGLRSLGAHTHVVSIGYQGSVGTSIAIDDVGGARLAVEHLVDLGHTRVAYVSGTMVTASTDALRVAGYKAALRRARIDPPAAFACRIGPRSDPARLRPVRELLLSHERPTAVFAATDITAIEIMSCAWELGLRVPDDLSLVGFDDMLLASVPMISLTTVAQPVGELARLGVRAVIDHLTPGGTPESAWIEPRLIVRGSTAGLPAGRPS